MGLKSEQSRLDDEFDSLQEDYCPNCGGTMEWCDSCRVWSQTCCQEYGTCECS